MAVGVFERKKRPYEVEYGKGSCVMRSKQRILMLGEGDQCLGREHVNITLECLESLCRDAGQLQVLCCAGYEKRGIMSARKQTASHDRRYTYAHSRFCCLAFWLQHRVQGVTCLW